MTSAARRARATYGSVEVAVERGGALSGLLECSRDLCGLGQTAWNGRHSNVTGQIRVRLSEFVSEAVSLVGCRCDCTASGQYVAAMRT